LPYTAQFMGRLAFGLLLVLQMNCDVWCVTMHCHDHETPPATAQCHETAPVQDETPDSDCEHENALNEESLQAKKAFKQTDFTLVLESFVTFNPIAWPSVRIYSISPTPVSYPPATSEILRI